MVGQLPVLTVKLGGDIVRKPSASLFADLRAVTGNHCTVIVHGGGDEVTEIADRLGKPQRFVVSPTGIKSRYTDSDTIQIYTMVMCGKNNKEIVSRLEENGVRALGISGLDGGAIRAERKEKLIVVEDGRKRIIDGGFTGQITGVNDQLLMMLMRAGYVPVIAPVALGAKFEFLNVDSDRAAAHVAGAIKAESLILLTDVLGVILNDALVRRMGLTDAKVALKKVGFGMEKKVLACIEAVELGVEKAIIASGMVEEPITRAIAEENCTVITR